MSKLYNQLQPVVSRLDNKINNVKEQLQDVRQELADIETDWGSSIIDDTLSIKGAAADAKAVGDYHMTNAQAVNLLITGAPIEKDEDDILGDKIQGWLDEHPEAINIQDESIICTKLEKGTLNFVTPEMYGAKGDGETDDSDAIQLAINSGFPVYFSKKTYLISKTIHLYSLRLFNLNAENATITYTGDSYAFDIRALRYSTLKFGSIISNNGGCLYFDGSVYAYWTQYVNIYFGLFQAGEDSACVYANGENTWINEIRWHNGRLASGLYGFRISHTTTEHNITHWSFYNIGFEGITTGLKLEALSDDVSRKGIYSFLFDGCRYEESFTSLITSTGRVRHFTFLQGGGGSDFPTAKIYVDENATQWRVYGLNGSLKLINGQWVREFNHYALSGGILLSSDTDLNNIVDFGSYYCNTNRIVATLVNCPTDRAFSLTIQQRAGEYYRRQIIHTYMGATYERSITSYDSGQTWTFGNWISDEWVNVSSSVVYDSTLVTNGALILFYNAKLGLAIFSGNVTVSLAAGTNVIGTLNTTYRSQAYYVALNASWGQIFTARIAANNKITVVANEAYSGTLAISGIWKVHS